MKATSLLFLMISLVTIGQNVHAAAGKKVLISVGDFIGKDQKSWKKETCQKVFTLANQIVDNGTDVVCREFDTNEFKDSDLEKFSKKFDYHLRITRNYDQSLGLDITNWNRKHDSDFQTLGWNLQDFTLK